VLNDDELGSDTCEKKGLSVVKDTFPKYREPPAAMTLENGIEEG